MPYIQKKLSPLYFCGPAFDDQAWAPKQVSPLQLVILEAECSINKDHGGVRRPPVAG